MTKNFDNKQIASESMAASVILLVDDDVDMLDYLQECLTSIPATFLRAANGKDALELCLKEKIDLVITDISMPVIDGLELLGMMRDRRDFTPVIMLTGHEDHEKVRRAWKLGAYSYVEKMATGKQIANQALAALDAGRKLTEERYLAGSSLHQVVSVSLDRACYRDVLAHCLDQGISLQSLIERLLKQQIAASKSQSESA